MFGSGSKQAKKEMEAILTELQVNLENNYKDLAIDARDRAVKRLEELKHSGELKPKEIEKISARVADYEKRMSGYKSQSGKKSS